jgi:hypothetical protein
MTTGSGPIGMSTAALRRVEDFDEPRPASAASVVAGAERDINRVWRDSVAVGDAALSEVLAELSHALRRAVRVLDRPGRAIG